MDATNEPAVTVNDGEVLHMKGETKTGDFPAGIKPVCPRCGGRGFIETALPTPGTLVVETMPCPECNKA